MISTAASCLQWKDLHVTHAEMKPLHSLNIGQCFNWKRISSDRFPTWIGMVDDVPLAIREVDDSTEFAALLHQCEDTVRDRLKRYFQLECNLRELYDRWASRCDRMTQIARCLPGVRVVQQDPWECLISFICSSNNNISRITQMLNKLRYHYGVYSCSIHHGDGDTQVFVGEDAAIGVGGVLINHRPVRDLSPDGSTASAEVLHLFSFPTPRALAAASEEDLRSLGMGYRAKFIIQTAQLVVDRQAAHGEDWLVGLRNRSPEVDVVAHRRRVNEALQAFPGVGPKVADCVALFSLDQSGVIPVDTHVWSIVNRDYAHLYESNKLGIKLESTGPVVKREAEAEAAVVTTSSSVLRSSSLTLRVYDAVGEVFRSIFGERAGWAHSVLFAAELPQFAALLPDPLRRDMQEFSQDERKRKQTKKAELAKRKRVKAEATESEETAAPAPKVRAVKGAVKVKIETIVV